MKLDYVTFDSLLEGVGASQVRPYVERMATSGLDVVLHSFERIPPDPDLVTQLASVGVRWQPRAFGPPGAAGGVGRVVRAAAAIRGAQLVHCRSDLAAAAALVARPRKWVWDMRSFWREQRIDLGMLRSGSAEERVMRRVEQSAAHRADVIVTLAATAVSVLADRYGAAIADKCVVIPTCVDLHRFRATPLPEPPMRFLLSGTLNNYYDVRTMVRLVARAQRRSPEVSLQVLAPDRAALWRRDLAEVDARISSATPEEMPTHVEQSTVGLSLCRTDVGVSLSAAMPTKIAEFLASGRPIAVSSGIGDLNRLLAKYQCGVLVSGTDDANLDRALDELEELTTDPAVGTRCRKLAEDHFDVDRAASMLVELYRGFSS